MVLPNTTGSLQKEETSQAAAWVTVRGECPARRGRRAAPCYIIAVSMEFIRHQDALALQRFQDAGGFFNDRVVDLALALTGRGEDGKSRTLSAVSFERCDLTRSNLAHATILDTTFHNTVLRGGALGTTTLKRSDLYFCDLNEAVLEGADARRMRLHGCQANNARFGRASLSVVRFEDTALYRASFRGAVLVRVSFTDGRLGGAALNKADFSGARLVDVSFKNANLAGASFRGATLLGVDFSGAFLDGADFEGAAMVGCRMPLPAAR